MVVLGLLDRNSKIEKKKDGQLGVRPPFVFSIFQGTPIKSESVAGRCSVETFTGGSPVGRKWLNSRSLGKLEGLIYMSDGKI